MITNIIASRNTELLDAICPGWEVKERDYKGDWEDFVFSIFYDKLMEEEGIA